MRFFLRSSTDREALQGIPNGPNATHVSRTPMHREACFGNGRVLESSVAGSLPIRTQSALGVQDARTLVFRLTKGSPLK